MNWTDERVEKLKKLWSEGLSASQIAAQLGGVSRNAVIGKVHRLSLPGRAKAGGSTAAAARPKRATSAPRAPNYAARSVTRTVTRTAGATALKEELAVDLAIDQELQIDRNIVLPMSRRLELTELTERTCKWPIGDPLKEEFHFCGNDSPEASPYCTFHARLAYQPSAERRRMR
ncbi:GcrA family cell cycle regulator [Sinorhizobium meliloti]|jgi:GcrA cell cycle regulator|uniref:GcrA cell cycle regulator n=1 Tax=Rhizobium meliloti TaxID=382 RepID=A0A6A7ZTI8_RHIML|nr:GcrA family cell cycle regulator [Sinorhizobium meliloti]MDW9416877.1 GcrA cell cycle regulator [Sinorhizobium meliloti]MDW9480222.1 GcrA cell cycle regulator [Sinorhizobium meliloti]MDW9513768.1 GcrA cell cycle regulator [Sinorhizobium meliloti]MDW9594073.1 GcrA cell cycle regulator [Sinorhizobium meliloti]MDW9636898.1 GcrA cell cycle regulator [Sinorhizobium meliloti]